MIFQSFSRRQARNATTMAPKRVIDPVRMMPSLLVAARGSQVRQNLDERARCHCDFEFQQLHDITTGKGLEEAIAENRS